eukprot:gene5675-biopygen19270
MGYRKGIGIRIVCRWLYEGNAPYTIGRLPAWARGWPRDGAVCGRGPQEPFGASVGRRGGWGGGPFFSVRFLDHGVIPFSFFVKNISVEPRALGVSRYYGWNQGVV